MKLEDLGIHTIIKTGNLDVNAEVKNGLYPFFTCSKEHKQIDYYSFDGEYILVAGNGDLNVKYYNGKFNAYQRTYAIRPKDSVHGKYLYYFLEKYVVKLRELSIGGVIKYIKIGNLTEAKIPLPPLPQQHKIANILDVADALRQNDKALMAKYDELAQVLFLDMFGDVINNQKKWEYVNFGTVFKSIRYGTSTPPIYINEGIPFIRATNVKNGTVAEKGMVYISSEEASKIEKCKLMEGNLIVVRSGANTGDCCRIPSNYKDGYGGFDLIIEIDEPYSTFYNFLLNTKAGKKTLDPLTRRAGQPHLNSKQMTDVQVILPPIKLQNQFSERIAIIEEQKAIAQKSLEKSEELFNSLLQKAFKGELV